MVQAFEEELERKRSQTNVTVSAKNVSVNPFCTQCECEVSRTQAPSVFMLITNILIVMLYIQHCITLPW